MIKFRPRDTCSEQEEVVWEKEDEKTLPTRRGMTGGGGGGSGRLREGRAGLPVEAEAETRTVLRTPMFPAAPFTEVGGTPPVRQQTNEQAKCTTYR